MHKVACRLVGQQAGLTRRHFSSVDPQVLVAQLDRFIIGQEKAKRAIAVAVRDRWARLQVSDVALRREITPANILLIGSSGSGKTEIARRLATLIDAPFVKVVATKYTEVGFVGDSTTSMIDELAEQALLDVTKRLRDQVQSAAQAEAVQDVARLLIVHNPATLPFHQVVTLLSERQTDTADRHPILDQLVSVDASTCAFFDLLPPDSPSSALYLPSRGGAGGGGGKRGGPERRPRELSTRTVAVGAALEAATTLHRERLMKQREGRLKQEAVEASETRGIIFIDEFDKLVEDADNAEDAGSFKSKRRGVQKELLTLIEGTSVQTAKLGRVNTDHMLFICAGAFSYAKPSMMMPELQGRLQTQVKLDSLTSKDLAQIMTHTEFNIIRQQQALMKAAENVDLVVEQSAIEHLAEMAEMMNSRLCNTGARRLQQLLSLVLEDAKFHAHNHRNSQLVVDKDTVQDIIANKHPHTHKLLHTAANTDYRKFVI